jgi:hypothetical protein
VKNFATGRLPDNSSPKSSQDKTQDKNDFERLIATHRRISAISDPIERRFELNRIAPAHSLPRAECRRLYELWVLGGAA